MLRVFRVNVNGILYFVAHLSPELARQLVAIYMAETNGEIEGDPEKWIATEQIEPFNIYYDEYDEKGNQIVIPSNEYVETIKEPEIISCTDW